MKSNYYDMLRLLVDVEEEHEKSIGTKLQSYWQGKKDGLRIGLSLLGPDPEEREQYVTLLESSSGSHATEREILRAQVEEAYRIAKEIVQRKSSGLCISAQKFMDWVDYVKISGANSPGSS